MDLAESLIIEGCGVAHVTHLSGAERVRSRVTCYEAHGRGSGRLILRTCSRSGTSRSRVTFCNRSVTSKKYFRFLIEVWVLPGSRRSYRWSKVIRDAAAKRDQQVGGGARVLMLAIAYAPPRKNIWLPVLSWQYCWHCISVGENRVVLGDREAGDGRRGPRSTAAAVIPLRVDRVIVRILHAVRNPALAWNHERLAMPSLTGPGFA